EVQRERRADFPIVLEEDVEFILARVDVLSSAPVVLPLQVLRVLQKVDLLRARDGAGEEIQKLIRERLIGRIEIREIGCVEERLIGVVARAARSLRDR